MDALFCVLFGTKKTIGYADGFDADWINKIFRTGC